MIRKITFLGVLVLGPLGATADPVTDTCALYKSTEVCECASAALEQAIGPEAFADYASTSGTALEHQHTGAGLQDAWDRARESYAGAAGISGSEALRRMNEYGSAHRDAIKGCEG